LLVHVTKLPLLSSLHPPHTIPLERVQSVHIEAVGSSHREEIDMNRYVTR